jgi:hypothetical protein
VLWALNLVLDNVWWIYAIAFFKFDVPVWALVVVSMVVSPILTTLRSRLHARRLARVLDLARATPAIRLRPPSSTPKSTETSDSRHDREPAQLG